ncbi:MAG: preprotein translocase subunit SecG [Rickettsia endosymbiont of Bryobia graminum]|nr:preprotein translocase subunit SecG [Rickettsia endosymbiont of Bryobia graminum]
MMNILLFVHVVIAILLIIVILMQKTGSDGLSGIGGNNMGGVVAGRTVANFLTKTTVVLAACFIINAIVLANLSSRRNAGIIEKIDQVDDNKPVESTSLPIAK